MFIRKITRHLQDQNWFAALLDLVIVVVGVFIGLQVNNWNEQRLFDAKERDYLVQLGDELDLHIVTAEYQMQFFTDMLESGRRALTFLEADQPCTEQCADLLVDFFHASQVWGTRTPEPVFREMERLGLPRKPDTRASVRSFYLQIAGWDIIKSQLPAYRETVRGFFSPDASALMWRKCYQVTDGNLEVMVRDCLTDLEGLDTAGMLENIRRSVGMAEQLRFWIGQNNFAHAEYDKYLARAQQARAAIDKDLRAR